MKTESIQEDAIVQIIHDTIQKEFPVTMDVDRYRKMLQTAGHNVFLYTTSVRGDDEEEQV